MEELERHVELLNRKHFHAEEAQPHDETYEGLCSLRGGLGSFEVAELALEPRGY